MQFGQTAKQKNKSHLTHQQLHIEATDLYCVAICSTT